MTRRHRKEHDTLRKGLAWTGIAFLALLTFALFVGAKPSKEQASDAATVEVTR